jgi:cholesterol oxidase
MATQKRRHARTDHRFDYEVVIIGSGFGGSVAALRAEEKG